MTAIQGFIVGYMSKEAAPGTSRITDKEDFYRALKRMRKSKRWRFAGLAPSAGTLAGGYLGGRIGEWTADNRRYKDRIRRAMWGAIMGAMVGGASGTAAQVWMRAPLKNRLIRDTLEGMGGS